MTQKPHHMVSDMNYYGTFIRVAPDCPATEGTVPKERGGKQTLGLIQYELLAGSPYALTQEDVLWEGHVRHKGLPSEEATPEAREAFFSKEMACLRASALPKQYGWGLHFDEEGKIKLYGVETEEYAQFAEPKADGPEVKDAMRNKRA
ncbi:MAG: DUF6157 family protein [Rhodothermales bacterium]